MAEMRTTSGDVVNVKMKDLIGRKAKLRRESRNGVGRHPAGTIVTIDGFWRSGVHVEAPPCKCCGVSVYIRKVHRDDVLLAPELDAT